MTSISTILSCLPALFARTTSQNMEAECRRPLEVQGSMRRAAEDQSLESSWPCLMEEYRGACWASLLLPVNIWAAISCQVSIGRVALKPEMAQGGQKDSQHAAGAPDESPLPAAEMTLPALLAAPTSIGQEGSPLEPTFTN